jgi:hypothetical protein
VAAQDAQQLVPRVAPVVGERLDGRDLLRGAPGAEGLAREPVADADLDRRAAEDGAGAVARAQGPGVAQRGEGLLEPREGLGVAGRGDAVVQLRGRAVAELEGPLQQGAAVLGLRRRGRDLRRRGRGEGEQEDGEERPGHRCKLVGGAPGETGAAGEIAP